MAKENSTSFFGGFGKDVIFGESRKRFTFNATKKM
jgi:hypothetical protein